MAGVTRPHVAERKGEKKKKGKQREKRVEREWWLARGRLEISWRDTGDVMLMCGALVASILGVYCVCESGGVGSVPLERYED